MCLPVYAHPARAAMQAEVVAQARARVSAQPRLNQAPPGGHSADMLRLLDIGGDSASPQSGSGYRPFRISSM